MSSSDNNSNSAGISDDELFKLDDEEKQSGLKAIESIAGTVHLYIIFYNKQCLKVDLSLKDWSSKLKTESRDIHVADSAVTAALKRMHMIESIKLLELANSNKVQSADNAPGEKPVKSIVAATATTLSPDKDNDAEKLMRYLEDSGHEIFMDQHGHTFIVTKDPVSGIEEPLDLADKDFVEYATDLFYDWTGGKVIHPSQVDNVATILSNRAKRKNFDPDTGEIIVKPLYVRVAWLDPVKQNTIVIDIADTKRHLIAIEKGQGFKVISQKDAPIMFRRHNRLALPMPATIYDPNVIEEFLTLFQIGKDEYTKRLIAKVMLAIRLIPGIPHPIELVHGSKGSIKSSWCEAEKIMLDPSTNKTLTIPDKEDDFALQGYHNYILVYDNIKRKNVPKWFPDALCRYVYQEDVEKRQHYSNMKTVSFGSSGCAIVNGINKMFEEEDVLDRCVMQGWHRLKKGQFRTKKAVREQFQRLHPQILACLCDVVSKALAIYPAVEKEIENELTRMADFMVWGEAIARAFGYKKREFIEAYTANLEEQNIEIIQNSTLGKVLVNFVHREFNLIMNDRKTYGKAAEVRYNKAVGPKAVIVFEGTIDQLYDRLKVVAGTAPFNITDFDKRKDWPKGTNKLSQWIKLILSNLSDAFGIEIDITPDTTGRLSGKRNRIWVQITKNPDVAPADLFGDEGKDSKDGKGSGGDSILRTQGKGKDDGSPGTQGQGGIGSSGSTVKVLSNKSLQSLQSLQQGGDPTASGKDGKDRKDTLRETFTSATIETMPSLQEIVSLQAFENVQKLNPACQSIVFVDWEYESDESSRVYLFAYVDTQGNQGTLHIEDFPTLKEFAVAVNRIIEQYDYSCSWWGRGRDSDRLSDLAQWHNFCITAGAYQIVDGTSDYDQYPTIRSLSNPKHRHLDAHTIHSQTFIKSGIYKGAIQGMKLDEVHAAVFPDRKMGKYPGVDGSTVGLMPTDIQRAYCLRDAQMVYEIVTRLNGQLLGVIKTVAEYINRDIEYVCHARDMGYLVEPVLTAMGYLLETHWWDGKYDGGLVQSPERGRHKHAIGVDCVGMYPEIVINYNISGECICCTCCEYEPKARDRAITGDPELDSKGYWICVKQEGLFPKFMKGLKEKRQEFKKLRDNAKDAETYQQYDTAQLAIKIYMNASYGCFGFAGFKYKDKRVAELITGIGRKFAIGAKELAESNKYGFLCIYGDTDGLLLVEKQDSFTPDEAFTMDSAKARVKPLLDECYQRFNLPIDNDRNFLEVTPIEKKQYFGIDVVTKRVIVKGLEGKKSDACRFNQQQFKRLMENYEKGIDPIPDVKAGLERLDTGELSAEDLAINAKLGKDANEYPASSPLGKIARACNGKKDDVVQYFLTGQKGNAFSPYFEDCNIAKYKHEHLTDIGKVLYAMGYEIDSLYGPEMKASEILRKRQEKNDKKKNSKLSAQAGGVGAEEAA